MQKEDKKIEKANKKFEEEQKKEKERIIKSGSIEDVLNNQHKLSDTELQTAINRIQKNKQLKDLDRQMRLDETQAKTDKINKGIAYVDTIIKGYNKYEDVARLANKISGHDILPVFTEKGAKEHKAFVEEITKSLDYNKIMQNRNKLSADEFNAALNAYHNDAEKRGKAAKAAEEILKRNQDAKTDFETNLTTAQTRTTTLRSEHATKTAAVTTARANVVAKEHDVSTAESDVASKDSVYKAAKRAYKEARRTHDPTEAAKEAAMNSAELDLDHAKRNLRTEKENLLRAKEEHQRAKEEETEAKNRVKESEEKEEEIKKDIERAQSTIENVQREVWSLGH
jgi:hypothetical protein